MKYHCWYNDEFTLGLKVGPKCEAKTTLQKTVLQTLDSHNFFFILYGCGICSVYFYIGRHRVSIVYRSQRHLVKRAEVPL